ncbi:piggyBac transposable element-derived protein 2-like [Lates japonicus]|uniref:PiggyBac transposable element-derived protein 2-like protein n=1 Tax=Lates japonicus TaxID=270547 RepID=A0AAD3NN08_LATJO|nr:piggyBac transposable element-derived protein 2-like protein [Lates japonicus]
MSGRMFDAKRRKSVVVPAHPAISDDDEEDDDDVADPDFVPPTHNQDIPCTSDTDPSAKRKRIQPVVEVLQENYSEYSEDDDDDDDDDDDGDDNVQPAVQAQRPRRSGKSAPRPTTLHKVDLNNTALPEYQHSAPDYIDMPFQYFIRYFDAQIISHITYQTNLYATQKDINTTFSTNENEIMTFLAILIYMGVVELPSVEDYWAMETRVPQVANLMSSKRFRLLKRVIHFNDNTQIPGTSDRFFKVRPLFSFLNNAFRREPQTPKQSVDEVMVAYKGKTAGNLRQYIKNKPDKWGFKLFARASEDGFIHDMVLYQGKTTLEAHDVPLMPEQKVLGATSQIVAVLASTMSSPTTTAIFADNFFTSMELVRYLRDQNCRYTGTARDNRIRNPPLKSIKEMEKKAVPRGTYDYVTSDDRILAVRWKDNRKVTLLSTDMGVELMSSVIRYCSETKMKEPVSCPAVIRSYNASMGGIDKSDMLVHLYRTPMKSKRWYLRLFAYVIDVSITNAWVVYRRDSKALGVNGQSLKDFRIQVFRGASGQMSAKSSSRKSLSSSVESLTTSVDVPEPVRGHHSHTPNEAVRFDLSLFHAPVHAKRQTCKYCSRKGNIVRSNVVCRVCKVHLCMNSESNCFIRYHE